MNKYQFFVGLPENNIPSVIAILVHDLSKT